MSIFFPPEKCGVTGPIGGAADTKTSFSIPREIEVNLLAGMVLGGCISLAPAIVGIAAGAAGGVAGWLGAGGVESAFDSMFRAGVLAHGGIFLTSMAASFAWAIDVMTVRKTAAALGESELRRMSGIEPFLNFASAMKDDQWLVKDAGADAVPQVMSWGDYRTWRDKVDASDVPVVLLTVNNVHKDVLNPNQIGYEKFDSYSEYEILIAQKMVRGVAVGLTDEDPFMRIYWASEKAMKAYGFTEVTNESCYPMNPQLREAYDSMPGKGILAGSRDTPYDYGIAHSIRERASEIISKFGDGLKRMFGPGRDPEVDASASLDGAAESGPRL